MRTADYAAPIAFRVGQIDALARTLLASPALTTAEIRASLALTWLARTLEQYREDRAITLGARLIGAECNAQRNAFLVLIEHALPAGETPLAGAIRLVRKIAIRPLAGVNRHNKLQSVSLAQCCGLTDHAATAAPERAGKSASTASIAANPQRRVPATVDRL